jgi:pimeloyl-ACP methyl ester carboxylesterase
VTIVDDAVGRHAGVTPVVLGGFSQGGALALALALRARPPVASTLAGAFAGPAPASLWLGWGNGGRWGDRDRQVLELLADCGASKHLLALGFTASGQPRHPLYAPATASLQPLVLAQSQQAAAF